MLISLRICILYLALFIRLTLCNSVNNVEGGTSRRGSIYKREINYYYIDLNPYKKDENSEELVILSSELPISKFKYYVKIVSSETEELSIEQKPKSDEESNVNLNKMGSQRLIHIIGK